MDDMPKMTLTLECRIFTSTVSDILCEHQILHKAVKLCGEYYIRIDNVIIFTKSVAPKYIIFQEGALGMKQCVIDSDMITSFQFGGI